MSSRDRSLAFRQRFSGQVNRVERALPEILGAHLSGADLRAATAVIGLRELPTSATPSKRLRGALYLLVHDQSACQKIRCEHMAAGLEVLHCASLIIDDVQDGDTWRGGKPAVWADLGIPQALSLALELMAVATAVAAQAGSGVAGAFGQTMLDMSVGQAADLTCEHGRLGLEEYERIARLKTSALLKCAVICGGHDCGRETITALAEFATTLGILHQLRDDLDDYEVQGGLSRTSAGHISRVLGDSIVSPDQTTALGLLDRYLAQATDQLGLSLADRRDPLLGDLTDLCAVLVGRVTGAHLR